MKTLLRADLAMIFRGKFFWISVAVSLAVECFGLALGFVYPLFDRRSGTRDMIGFFGNAVVFLFLIFAAARHFCGGMQNGSIGAKIAAGHTRTQVYGSLTVSGLCALAVRYLLWLLFALLYTGLIRLVIPEGIRNGSLPESPTPDGIAAELWYAAPGLLVFLAMCVMFCALTKNRTVAAALTAAVLFVSLQGALLLPYLAEISAELRELYEPGEPFFDEEDESFYNGYGVDPNMIYQAEKYTQRLAGLSDGARNALIVTAKLLPFRARMEYKEYADDRYPARGPEPEHPDLPPKQIFEQCAYLTEAAVFLTAGLPIFRKKEFN